MVLNVCGRPTPPPGYRFVDLPRIIPFFLNLTNIQAGTPPTQGRIANTADTVFICRGVGVPKGVGPNFRIRWPDGRFLSQNPGGPGNIYPLGVGGNLLAMDQERAIQPDERISIEVSAIPPAPPAPLLSIQEELIPGQQGSPQLGTQYFGISVAIDGNQMVVGYADGTVSGVTQGCAFVYLFVNGSWVFQALLTASDGAAGDIFGYQVDIQGGTIAVSAPFATVSGHVNAGKVYVYTVAGSVWTQQQIIPSPTPGTTQEFGQAIKLFANDLWCGNADGIGIFTRSGGVWTETATLLAGTVVSGVGLPTAFQPLALNASTAIVGLPAHGGGGEVLFYSLVGSTWTLIQTIADPEATAGDRFGNAVSLSGNLLAVGAPLAGRVYIYQLTAGPVYTLIQTIVDPAGFPFGGGFGQAVGLDTANNSLIVGADSANSNQGLVYYYTLVGGVFVLKETIPAADGAGGDLFGASVANVGGQVAIGAPTKPIGAQLGRVYVAAFAPLQTILPVSFWGVLRYMLKDTRAATVGADCVVGYGVQKSGQVGPVKLAMMPDPAEAYALMPRLQCRPNQNLMAPEFLVGNQCRLETPPGYKDESFTFFSPPITVPAGGQTYGTVIIVPGSDDVVIRSITAYVTYEDGLLSAIPTLAMRLPNGYAVTGGDMVPLNLVPGGIAVFPTLRIGAGGRIIVDMADMNAFPAGVGASITLLEFDGVKRRKVAR